MQVVVANLLETRKTTVTMVAEDSEEKLELTQEEMSKGVEIEEAVVNSLVIKHQSLTG